MDEDDDGVEDTIIHPTFFKHKGKNETYLKQKDIILEVKIPRKAFKNNRIKDEMPEGVTAKNHIYNFISTDIWYHISEYIPPEEVQTFALICRQTADLVKTRRFWRGLYRRYCQTTFRINQWKLKLPDYLQMENIHNCETKLLRSRVIESLYRLYTPFMDRIGDGGSGGGYSLEILHGRTYTASWHMQCQCIWIMCYKFWNQSTHCKYKTALPNAVANDWESLVDNENNNSEREEYKFINPHEGVCLLIVCCDRFIPFPTQLLYGSAESRIQLADTRQMLTKDMRGSNLELDLVDIFSKVVTTVKYPHILKYKVLPWWHPDFRKFIK